MNRVIVAGSRTFKNYPLLANKLDVILVNFGALDSLAIISGGAPGADKLGEKYAQEKQVPLILVRALWHLYGDSAGPKRNALMAEIATHCVVFWDGQSLGAKSMIGIAKAKSLPLRVIRF